MRRRDLLLAAPALTLAGSAAAVAPAPPEARMLAASRFGAVGDGRADDTEALQKALDATFRGAEAGLLRIEPGTYRVTRPLRIVLEDDKTHRFTRQHGISARGALIRSEISDGNVIDLTSQATARFFLIDGIEIRGRGQEGHGISMRCSGQGHYLYNLCLRDVVVQGCGGDGCRMVGNIFEGQIVNSYFRDNKGNGATFGHDKKGGILSAMHVFGAVFGGNGGDGVALVDQCADVSFHGCYFLLNDRFGVNAGNGCTLLSNCGFENNHRKAKNFTSGDAGIRLQVFGTLVGCTAYSIHYQTHLVNAFVTNQLVMVGCTASGGGDAHGAGLAKLQGNGRAGATLIGCRGAVVQAGGIEAVEIGGGGVKFGAKWDSGALPRLGDYTLWVDGTGRLRIKRGLPQADQDGMPVGT